MNKIKRKKIEKIMEESVNSIDAFDEQTESNSIFIRTKLENNTTDVKIKNKHGSINDLIYETPNLDNYSKYSEIISDYFAKMEKNHKSFALLIGSLFSNKEKENIKELLQTLERTDLSREDVISAIESARAGARNSSTRILLQSLSKLYEKNNSVYERFKKKARKQNPICDFIENAKVDYKINESKKEMLHQIFFQEKEDIDYKNLFFLEKELFNSIKNGILEPNTTTEKLKEYLKKDNIEISYGDVVEKYEDVVKINALDRLKQSHEKAESAARIFTVKAFQGQNKLDLGSLFYQNVQDEKETNKNIEILQEKFKKVIAEIKTSKSSVKDAFSPSVTKRIIDKIANSYILKNDLTDSVESNAIHVDKNTQIPYFLSQEEEFMKMVQDTIYNEMMKEKSLATGVSGMESYNALVDIFNKENFDEKLTHREEAIDIEKNFLNGLYRHPSQGGEDYMLAKDALELWNTRTIAKAVSQGKATREEALRALDKTLKNSNLKDAEKKVFIDEVMKNYNNPDLLKSFEPDREIDLKTGDIIAHYEAKKIYAQLFKKNKLNSIGNLKITSKEEIILQNCIEAAAAPKMRSHSASSEISQCFDKYKQKLEEYMKKVDQAAGSPAVALTGLFALTIIISAFQESSLRELEANIHQLNKSRIDAISFIKQSETELEKTFRANILKNSKFNLSDEIVNKKDLDEWIYKMIIARHDYQEHKDVALQKATSRINSETTMEKKSEVLHDSLVAILDRNGIREELSAMAAKKNEENEKQKKEAIQKSKNAILLDLENIRQGKKSEDNTFKNLIKDLSKGYKSGAVSLEYVKKETNLTALIFKESLTQTKTELKKLQQKISILEKRKKEIASLKYPNEFDKKEREIAEKELKEIKNKIKIEEKIQNKIQNGLLDFEKLFDELSLFDKKLTPKNLSQKEAFGKSPDKNSSTSAFKTRYTTEHLAMDSLIQDLKLLEEFQENNLGRFSAKQLQSITTMKALLRNYYASIQVEKSGGRLSKKDVFRDIYTKRKEGFTETSDIDFTVIRQKDETKAQILYREKATEQEQEKNMFMDIIKATNTLKEDYSPNKKEKNKFKTLKRTHTKSFDSLEKARQIIEDITGVEISTAKDSPTSSQEGKTAERTNKSINREDSEYKYEQKQKLF